MKIEAGKTYELLSSNELRYKGEVFTVKKIDGKKALTVSSDGKLVDTTVSILETFDLKDVGEHVKQTLKPAHYDTEIDTIAFAKANFSREQVEGFMRINAIKYLQRAGKKDDKLSDLRKSAHYLQMLIEMEEGK